MRIQLSHHLYVAFISSILLALSIGEELSNDFDEEDRARWEILKLSDLTGKGLRFELSINKTDKSAVQPKVHDLLDKLTSNMRILKKEITSLRQELRSCGNVSEINKAKAWVKVFKYCIQRVETELIAVTALSKIISIRAKTLRNFKYELSLKPVNETLIKAALAELNNAKRQLASGYITDQCRSIMAKDQEALMKFGKSLVMGRNYIRLQAERMEKSKGFFERMETLSPL